MIKENYEKLKIDSVCVCRFENGGSMDIYLEKEIAEYMPEED